MSLNTATLDRGNSSYEAKCNCIRPVYTIILLWHFKTESDKTVK